MAEESSRGNPFLTREGIARIAALARLVVGPDELSALAPQMERIARHVDRIREIPEADLPAEVIGPPTPLREDTPVPGDGYEELSANATSVSHRHVAVPRVVE